MIVYKTGYNSRYVYGGAGILDTLFSAVTSQVVKDAAAAVGKKAITDVGNKLTSKAINHLIPPTKKSKLTNENQAFLDRYSARASGSGIMTIQDYVKRRK